MTMPTSGPISIGMAINECNADGDPYGAVSPHAGDFSLSKLAGVAAGTHLQWSYWYGKSLGLPVYETGTQFFDQNYTHAMWANFGYSLMMMDGPASAFSSGGQHTNSTPNPANGVTFPSSWPNGAYTNGIMRDGRNFMIYAENCSLDGMTYASSVGDSFTLTLDDAYTWQIGSNWYTVYWAESAISQSQINANGDAYTANLAGSANRPQPKVTGYGANPVASTGGGSPDGGGGSGG